MATQQPFGADLKFGFQGSAARQAEPNWSYPLPQEQPTVRPVRKPRKKQKAPIGLMMTGAVLSLVLVVIGGVLISRWANIRALSDDVVAVRAETLKLRAENQSLTHEVTRMQSIAQLKDNAVKMGMEKPFELKQAVSDTSVVAKGTTASQPAASGWLDKLKGLLRRISG